MPLTSTRIRSVAMGISLSLAWFVLAYLLIARCGWVSLLWWPLLAAGRVINRIYFGVD